MVDDADLKWIADNVPDNIMLLDLEKRIRYINWTVPGLTPEGVVGTPVHEFVEPKWHAVMTECYARVEETGLPSTFKTEYVGADGDVSEWESRVAPARRDGEIVGFICVSSNITERLRADLERERFFTLSSDLLCVATLDGFFKRVNGAFKRTLGYTEAELTNTPFIDFVHEDDRERTNEAVDAVVSGEIVDIENRYRTKDGSYRLLSWRAVAEPDVGLIYATARDITQRKGLEDELRQSQKMDAIGKLTGGIAHDFNNLVLAIIMNADLGLATSDPEAAQASFREIIQTATRAADLIKQLQAFSRRQTLASDLIDLNEVTQNLMEMLRRLIPAHIDKDFIPGHELPSVRGDATQLEQVILNLCITRATRCRRAGA